MELHDFLRLVREELDTIKANATKEEIGRLDFTTFHHDGSRDCIYGQMTGHCRGNRALEIMDKSLVVIKTVRPEDDREIHLYLVAPNDLITKGVPRFTYLEQYLFWSSSFMHEKIISYLKGEVDDIVLELDF